MTLETISTVVTPRAVLTLPVATIAVPVERIGFFDARHAEGLGADIAANGQHDPIHVQRNGNAAKMRWTLVAGLHRLRGTEGAGLIEIDAIEVAAPGASAAELLRLELSENLDHRQRRPIKRAIFVIERARLEEAIDHPEHVGERAQDRAIRTRWDTSATMADVSGACWRDRTATALGCSIRSLERYQRIHRAIVVELPDEAWRREEPQARELPQLLNFHPLGESFKAMERLAGLNLIARLAAAKALLKRPEATSIDQVMVEAGIHESTGRRSHANDHEHRVIGHWSRAPLREKRAIGVQLATLAPPTVAEAMIEAFRARGLLS